MSRNKKMYGTYTPTVTYDTDGKPLYKVCSFCGEEKPITEFSKNGVDSKGAVCYRDDCKECYNIRRRENATKSRHSGFISGQKRRGEEAPDLSLQEWKEAVIFFKGQCAYCGCTTRKGQRLTRDHVVPISHGGKTTQDNIVPACASCNSSKGAEDWRDWFMRQPFFSQDRMNRIFEWRTLLRAAGIGDDIDE